MRVVFLDTVGLIALWDRTDQWHDAAVRAKASIDVPGVQAVTTTFVLLEFGNAAARKPYRADVGAFRQALAEEGNLIVPTDDDVEAAWADYAAGKPGDAGIVDHVSFVVMRRWASSTPSPTTAISPRPGSTCYSERRPAAQDAADADGADVSRVTRRQVPRFTTTPESGTLRPLHMREGHAHDPKPGTVESREPGPTRRDRR